jgi:hypothetical protein
VLKITDVLILIFSTLGADKRYRGKRAKKIQKYKYFVVFIIVPTFSRNISIL